MASLRESASAFAHARARALAPPSGSFERARWLLFVLCYLNVPVGAQVVVSGAGDRPVFRTALAAAAMVVLAGAWLLDYRQSRVPLARGLLEAAAIFAVIAALDPVGAQPLLWSALLFRCAYTGVRGGVANALLFWAAFVVALVLHRHAGSLFAVSSPAYQQFEATLVIGVIGPMFLKALGRHARSLARERVLTAAGTKLAATKTSEAALELAVEAALELMSDVPGARSSVLIGNVERMKVVAAAGADSHELLGVEIDVTKLPPELRSRLLELKTLENVGPALRAKAADHYSAKQGSIFVAPLRVKDRLAGALVGAGDGALPEDFSDSFETLGAQVGLSLERAELIEDARRSQARFRSLVQNSSDVVTVSDREGGIVFVTPSIERILGYRPGDVIGMSLLDLVHPDDAAPTGALLAEGARIKGPGVPARLRVRHSNGSWRHVESIGTNLLDDPDVRGYVVTTRDIGERKELEDELAHRAFHDPLTGLANRALFTDRVDHALKRHDRDARRMAVLFLDLDDFKTVNDSLGHAAGDELIEAVAERVRDCLRAGDTAARLGGDEFAVLLDELDEPEEAEAVAERLTEALRPAFALDGKRRFAYASIGIALSDPDRVETAEELLRNADVAMYIAKRRGKGRHEFYEPSMHHAAMRRLELKAELEQALESRQFVLHYQPTVELSSGRISGIEALVRWQHPERGLIPPGEFIPLAEETGLIVPVGEWVLNEALSQAKLWQQAYGQDNALNIGVNLSGRQLQHPAIVDEVGAALERSGLDPATVVLEITETVLLQDADAAVLTLRRLKDLGVRLAIDDFGTGYSSLGYLDRFPVDIVKIAKPFVDGVADGDEGSAVASAMITLGATLGLQTVAEGIEYPEQLERLRDLHCDEGQGFYLARPLEREKLDALLAERQSDWARLSDDIA